MITTLHRGLRQNDYSITWGGGYAQMITKLHRGEGSFRTPKSDYVICARPLVGCCTYTIKQFYSFREKLYCIKLYYILFKSMCLVTILLVDAATLLCLEVMAAEETNEPHHLYHLQDHLRQLFQDLDSRSWACALLAIFLLSHQTVFHLIFSSETRNDFHKVFYNRFPSNMARYSYSRNDFHKVFYNRLSIYVWGDTH